MIRVVFLDIDNTLLSFSGYVKQAMREGFAQFGLTPYREDMFPVFERVNNGLWRQIERGELTFERLIEIRWNAIFEALGIDFDGPRFEDYFRGRLFSSAVPEPHAVELLEYLSGRYVLCVASNGPYEQQINRLRVGGMHDYFSHFFISSKIGVQKPERAFFDRAFQELRETDAPGLVPGEAVIIGDSMTSDMAGGAAYGMGTVLYRPGATPGEAIAGVDHVVSDLIEITRLL